MNRAAGEILFFYGKMLSIYDSRYEVSFYNLYLSSEDESPGLQRVLMLIVNDL